MESRRARFHGDALCYAGTLPHHHLPTPVVLEVGARLRMRTLDRVAVARRHAGCRAFHEPSAYKSRKDHQPPGVDAFSAWGSVAHDLTKLWG